MIYWIILAVIYFMGMMQAALIVRLTCTRMMHPPSSVVFWPYGLLFGTLSKINVNSDGQFPEDRK